MILFPVSPFLAAQFTRRTCNSSSTLAGCPAIYTLFLALSTISLYLKASFFFLFLIQILFISSSSSFQQKGLQVSLLQAQAPISHMLPYQSASVIPIFIVLFLCLKLLMHYSFLCPTICMGKEQD